MITAETHTRKAFENASEDFVRGAVWAVKMVNGYIAQNRQVNYYEDIIEILKLEERIPDLIAEEKESYEFNRGASWGFEKFVMEPAKDESLDCGDRLVVIGGFASDIKA